MISGWIEIWRPFTREMERNQGSGETELFDEVEIERQTREEEDAERKPNPRAEEAQPGIE
jgi:hypothetical protein